MVWVPADHPLGEGAGWFLFFAQQLYYSFTRDHSMIGPLEPIAAAGAYTSMPDVFAGRDVLHFIDNTNALYGLAKGYSAAPDMVRIIRSFHIGNILGQADVWFDYVGTWPARLPVAPIWGLRKITAHNFSAVREDRAGA